MIIMLGLVILAVGIYLFFQHNLRHFMDNMPPEERTKMENAMAIEQERSEARCVLLKSLVVYRILNDSIRDGMSLDEMIDAFSRMCETSVGEPDDLLFETGIFDFTGEKKFHFSLVRQFQFLDSNEYVQLHLEILYSSRPLLKLFYSTKWGKPSDGSFFENVRNSPAYKAVNNLPIAGVVVRIDET